MFETTVAGSLPKPLWLAEPEKLWPAWRLEGEALQAGKIDATILAVKHQEDAGVDIVSDGEQARIHFVHGFLANLDGIDFARRKTIGIRADRYQAEVPTVTGPIRRKGSVHKLEASAARAATRRKLKFTLPGPMTIADTIADEHYSDRPALALAEWLCRTPHRIDSARKSRSCGRIRRSAAASRSENYASYYNQVRTHLSLDKNAPDFRRPQKLGPVAAISILGGLHHQYVRV